MVHFHTNLYLSVLAKKKKQKLPNCLLRKQLVVIDFVWPHLQTSGNDHTKSGLTENHSLYKDAAMGSLWTRVFWPTISLTGTHIRCADKKISHVFLSTVPQHWPWQLPPKQKVELTESSASNMGQGISRTE